MKNRSLTSLVAGKTVSIVGGAYPIDFRLAFFASELSVRVNDHWIRQGGRVDIAYCRNFPPWRYSHTLKGACYDINGTWADAWLAWRQLVPIELFDTEYYAAASPFGLDWCAEFVRSLNTMPLTGIMAIRHFQRFDVKAINLTGFDFYIENKAIPEKRDAHALYSQFDWLREQTEKDKRIHCDARLQEVLHNGAAR